VESTDELDSNSISSTSISSTDFLNYLYSSTLPKQLVRAFAPIGESGTAIPKQVVERELSSVRDESEKVDEEAVAESDDRQLSSVRDESEQVDEEVVAESDERPDRPADFLHYLYFDKSM
jgi:hypothetical protein